jgi:hypothetical protein
MLPDMVAVFNYQDEPRVLFNTRRPDAYEFALKKEDTNPFKQGPRPTKEYYAAESPHQCLLPNTDIGLGNLTNDVNAFLLSSTSTQHTHDLYPILSPARLSSCFADIVIPSAVFLSSLQAFVEVLTFRCSTIMIGLVLQPDPTSKIILDGKTRSRLFIGTSLLQSMGCSLMKAFQAWQYVLPSVSLTYC